ncbi:MAG TPA: alkaline phosphatase family protein [Ktedonobacterales bacterium]|nr:alkaline phosphatase family protein [Ktedonobacterales bacterium]
MNQSRRITRLTTRVRISGAFVLSLLGLLALLLAPSGAARADDGSGNRSDLKNFQHVFVIMMENTGFDSLIGNANAPWINAAAAQYGLATNYTGVTHPSQPNYIASTSGSTNGVANDNDTTVDVPNIVDQLEAHGKTWKAYMQSLSLCNGDLLAHQCGTASNNQLYERKHDPFISYTDVQNNPARVANIVDFSQLDTDLANNTVPDYVWISPDQCHDMHGTSIADQPGAPLCNFNDVDVPNGLIATGDAFLSATVSAIMNSPAWTGNSVIFITWDESDFTGSGFQGFGDDSGCCDAVPGNGGGRVVTLVISHSDHAPRTSGVAYNHYSMLATIEDGWKLGCLAFTCDTANVPPMSDLVGPQG